VVIYCLHGEEEMDEDGLSIFDVEKSILNGMIIDKAGNRWLGNHHRGRVEPDKQAGQSAAKPNKNSQGRWSVTQTEVS